MAIMRHGVSLCNALMYVYLGWEARRRHDGAMPAGIAMPYRHVLSRIIGVASLKNEAILLGGAGMLAQQLQALLLA